MDPIVYFLIGMFIITIGGTAGVVMSAIASIVNYRTLMGTLEDTVLRIFRR